MKLRTWILPLLSLCISFFTHLSSAGYECKPFLENSREILLKAESVASWMMTHPNKAIFVEGYFQRTLLALYEITGKKAYLEYVKKGANKLLGDQKPEGYWGTGYGDVYFADTGSALGLLINYYKFASKEEKRRIDNALDRYFHLLLVKGDSKGRPFVHEDGSLGVGFKADKEGRVTGDLNKPYTISTALTGEAIFAARYYMTGKKQYKRIAMKACNWILDTMDSDGRIPYIIEDWNPGGKNKQWVWERWPYDTSAYVGEGMIAAWVYIKDSSFRKTLLKRLRPHIEWLLRTQSGDGSWAKKLSPDQLRSHGVVNFLRWYWQASGPDPRIKRALGAWCSLVLDEERGRYLKIPGNPIATALGGRALVDLICPGVDCYRWKD